jgi:hypothetical protein
MFLSTVNSSAHARLESHSVPLGNDDAGEQGFVGELDDSEQGFWRNGGMKLEKHPHNTNSGAGLRTESSSFLNSPPGEPDQVVIWLVTLLGLGGACCSKGDSELPTLTDCIDNAFQEGFDLLKGRFLRRNLRDRDDTARHRKMDVVVEDNVKPRTHFFSVLLSPGG